MTASLSASVALVFLWLGMVAAISFLEAPLKFQAPGITVPLGLGIGRLVFRALTRRSDAVLADPENVPGQRSTAHLWYVAFEVVKVAALITLGTSLLTSV
ncbi:MAG: hypothetical protein QM658_11780 [Gordonia sp. (in: high G+C Gram-positive bacteria)]